MTKRKGLLNNCFKGILSLMVLGLFAVLTSCNNDDDILVVSHKIVYKAEASAGSNITSAGYYTGSEKITYASGVSGTMWVSPENNRGVGVPVGTTASQTAYANVKATGTSASSTLKVQIYVDDVLTKEFMTTGQDLNVEAKYEVPYSSK